MMAEAEDGITSVLEEELRILSFEVVILRGLPEIVPHHQAVLVGEGVEILLRVLAHPVADDVDVGIAVEPEIRLEMRDADSLAAVVHAPVAAPRGDAYAVDLDDQVDRKS